MTAAHPPTAPDTVAIAADHAGFALKDRLKAVLVDLGHPVLDLGTDGPESVDYPDFARALGTAIERGDARYGVAVCGTGVGISIALNRFPGVRAALCTSATVARLARRHNDANVLALGARIVGDEVARDCLEAFLASPYDGGRHDRRVSKLSRVLDPS